jgi:serine/threonine protein kinase
VKQFHTGTEDPENLFASLIIQSAQATRLPSGQQTPSSASRSHPVLYKKQIGKGAYGAVTFVWDLVTGEEYVVKRPLSNLIKSRMFVERHWKREADIMQSISHVRISVL